MPRPSKAIEQAMIEQRKEMVDEYGRLDKELSPLKGKLRRMEDLAKQIRSWHDDAPALQQVTAAGNEFEVVLSPRTTETRITDLHKVYRWLGRDQFLSLASISLRSLAEKLNAQQVAALTTKEATGYRPISVRPVFES